MIHKRGPWKAKRIVTTTRSSKPAAEPIPGVSVRCQCGRVVRVKANGMPRAHDYCKFAPASV